MQLKPDLSEINKLAKDKHNENKKYFDKLKKKPPKNLDYIMQELHDNEFKKTNCLNCANCCKTTGPLFTSADVERISKYLRLNHNSSFLNICELMKTKIMFCKSCLVVFWIMTTLVLYMKFVPKLAGNFRIPTEKSSNRLLLLQ